MAKTVLGIIGGSGVYDIDGLTDTKWESVSSPWGTPSDDLLFGKLDDVDLVFLPRHGRGHVQTPTSINYRANIDAMKRAGVTDIISVSACGSLREEYAPGAFVFVDQFIDRTFARDKSFLAQALSPMYRWHTQSARAWWRRLKQPPIKSGSNIILAVPIW